MQGLSNEEVYDALLDDEAMAGLPARLAGALGARSCVIHWRHVDGVSSMMAHSGYYSDDQLADYAKNYAWDDAWTKAALSPARANQTWNCDALVSERQLERTAFYDGWIRGMGDDTRHCMGLSADTPSGSGLIGLHRGKAQGAFEVDHVRELDARSIHLKRMLVVRGKLADADHRALSLEAALGNLGHPILIVSADARLRYANAAAELLLSAGEGFRVRQGKLTCALKERELKASIGRALDRTDPEACDMAIRTRTGRVLVASVVGLPLRSGRRDALIVIGGLAHDVTLTDRLRQLHGLSAIEASLAISLSEGQTLKEIADARGVSYETVKTQLKGLSAKLDAARQADVIRAVQALTPIRATAFIDA